MLRVLAVRGHAAGFGRQVVASETATLQVGEDLLGIVAECHAQVVDEPQLAVLVDASEERELREGRTAPDERAPGVVADAACHRGADATRPDHGMRLAAQRLEPAFELFERDAGLGQHLLAALQQVQLLEPQHVDEHYRAVVAALHRCGAAREACVGGLAEDDGAGGVAGLQRVPQLRQAAGAHHGQHVAAAVAKAAAVAARGRIARQHMAAADDLLESGQQVGGCEGGCRWHGRHARTGAPSTSRQRPSGLACCSAWFSARTCAGPVML